jgi:hypothetical protein
MTASSWFIVILVLVGSLLLVYGFSIRFPTHQNKKRSKNADKSQRGTATCPVCASTLNLGEQLKSAVFTGSSDQICHIFGCPHCYPFVEDQIERICPVCKQEIPPEGYLIARMFARKNQKNHVHITGCTECKKRRR